MELRLRCIILILTCLCILFIAVEEMFQSQFSTTIWKNSKTRLVAAKQVTGAVQDDRQHDHQPVVGIEEGDYGGEARFSGESAHQPQIQVQGWKKNDEYHGYDDKPKVQNRNRWKAWKKNIQENTVEIAINPPVNQGSLAALEGNVNQHWKLKSNIEKDTIDNDHLSEEEKLRQSPYIYHREEEFAKMNAPRIENEVKYFGYFSPGGDRDDEQDIFKSCRYKKCALVANLSDAELVVFTASSIRDYNIFTFQRPPGQRWLMYTIDPSIKKGYNFDGDDVKAMFNATMTYNVDADIPFFFGRLRKVPSRIRSYFDPIFEKKTKQAAWFVSHCVTLSRRELYVQRMQAVIDVDIFGQCGNLTCGGGTQPRRKDEDVCLPMLTNNYKFYLAFENSFCYDYITEKFFKLFKDVQIIPVVRGGFQYEKYLPSGTYINADDFQSPEALAQYLKDLGNDKQRYTEMLRKKDEWKLVERPSRNCLLCQYLHSNPPRKFYPNLKEKFGRGSCWFPKLKKLD